MKTFVYATKDEMGAAAANAAAEAIRHAIQENGLAYIILATGTSQFEMIEHLVAAEDIDWRKVIMFHLDEYIGLGPDHPASFRKYLKERFVAHVPIRQFHYVTPEGDIDEHLGDLGSRLTSAPIDLGIIGIGENGHIAFNDPPADFAASEPYIVVTLDQRCRRQQVGEGWFDDVSQVPEKAVTMTVRQILKCRTWSRYTVDI